MSLTVMPEGMAILWPPNGVLLAFLIRFGSRGYVPFASLAIVAEVAADLPTFHLGEALMFGLVNVAEATAASVLLARWNFDPRFATLQDLVKFVVAGPLLAAPVAAAFGASVYSTFRGSETVYGEFVRLWWFGDAVGLTIVTPLVLASWTETRAAPWPPPRLRRSDLLVGLGALGTLGLLVAARDGTLMGIHVGPVLLLPFVIFVAARFGLSISAIAVAAVSLVIMVLTTKGLNPFGHAVARDAVIHAQEFIIVMSLMTLGLAALLWQLRASQGQLERANIELRERADALGQINVELLRAEAEVVALNAGLEQRVRDRTRELEEALTQVKRLRGLLPICAWCKRVRDDEDYWHSVEDYISRRTDAQFSHGICPECSDRLLEPGDARSRR